MEPPGIITTHFIKIQAGGDIGQRDPLAGITTTLHAGIKHIAPDFRSHQFKCGDAVIWQVVHDASPLMRVASVSASRPSSFRM